LVGQDDTAKIVCAIEKSGYKTVIISVQSQTDIQFTFRQIRGACNAMSPSELGVNI
jgi:hypothetical protein